MHKVIVNGLKILLSAKHDNFIKQTFLGLNVGDKVVQIGRKTNNGKYSSSCRIFEVNPYMVYQGLFNDVDHTFICFLLPEGYLTNTDGSIFNNGATLLFSFIDIPGHEPELILQDYKKLSIMIFKAIFKIYNSE